MKILRYLLACAFQMFLLFCMVWIPFVLVAYCEWIKLTWYVALLGVIYLCKRYMRFAGGII